MGHRRYSPLWRIRVEWQVEMERAEMEVGEEPVMGGRFGEARFGDVVQEVLAFR
jgi:hypothetical protein